MKYATPIGRSLGLVYVAVAGALVMAWAETSRAQIPGLPTIPGIPKAADPAPKAKDRPTAAPTPDNPGATVATSEGPITVDKPVDDEAVRGTLVQLVSKYPGVYHVDAFVSNGVVTLEGHLDDDDTRDAVTEFTRKVQGVRLVLNRMQTDAQVMTGSQLAGKVLKELGRAVSQKWLLVVIALAMALGSIGAAKVFGARSETLLAPFVSNVLLRSVLGSLLSSLLILGGVMLGLSVLNLTHAVLSILGLASIVGLAVGFAFRDIAENFIASILLGVRRPFRIGDYVQVAGQAGVVLSLNTRATVLVTLEGNQVRIPNAVIYKEILVNSSASTSSRASFDVVVPYEVSTATALEAMTDALRSLEGVLSEPPARALVDALEIQGVRLRAYYWVPVQGVDGMKLQSDAKLKVKVALQQARIAPPPTSVMVSVLGHVPVDVYEADNRNRADAVVRPSAIVTPEQAKANLRQDSRAADVASAAPTPGHDTPVEHVMNQAMANVSEEGTNLLATANGEAVAH